MPDSFSSVLRRALSLGVFAALLASSFWLYHTRQRNAKEIKRKKNTKSEQDSTEELVAPITEISSYTEAASTMEIAPNFDEKDIGVSDADALLDRHEAEEPLLWSDMVDDDDLPDLSALENRAKSLPKFVPSTQRKSSSTDSGVASPTEITTEQLVCKSRDASGSTYAPSRKQSDEATTASAPFSTHPSCSSSDSGQGSEAGGGMRVSYHFDLPGHLCRQLIGPKGQTINRLRHDSNCDVTVLKQSEYQAALACQCCIESVKFRREFIRSHLLEEQGSLYQDSDSQKVIIEGTRQSIDRCLEYLRDIFPLKQNPKLTFEQLNKPNLVAPNYNNQQIMLAHNTLHQIIVSSIVSPVHIFVQDTTHPSYQALERFDILLNKTYSKGQCPVISYSDVVVDLVCVAHVDGRWYRAQVVSLDESSPFCYCKFLDFGGYANVEWTNLRKIRSDFLKLPFQAIECYLSNIIPKCFDEWPQGAEATLFEILHEASQVLTCRMLGAAEDKIPMIHLYSTNYVGQTRLLNRDIVDCGIGYWIDYVESDVNSQLFDQPL